MMNPVGSLAQRYHHWRERRQRRSRYLSALTTLEGLSGRDLADIGVKRADLPAIAEEMARR